MSDALKDSMRDHCEGCAEKGRLGAADWHVRGEGDDGLFVVTYCNDCLENLFDCAGGEASVVQGLRPLSARAKNRAEAYMIAHLFSTR